MSNEEVSAVSPKTGRKRVAVIRREFMAGAGAALAAAGSALRNPNWDPKLPETGRISATLEWTTDPLTP